MENKKIHQAVNYAVSTNKIEDLDLSKHELEEVKNAIVEKKNSESFLKDVIKKFSKEIKDGKTK